MRKRSVKGSPLRVCSTTMMAGPSRISSPGLSVATTRVLPFTVTPAGVSASTTITPSRPRAAANHRVIREDLLVRDLQMLVARAADRQPPGLDDDFPELAVARVAASERIHRSTRKRIAYQ